MFCHYIVTALRNLSRNKLNSIINIIGLAVSISIFILIMRYIQDELLTDKFHINSNRLYRVEFVDFAAACPAGLADVLIDQFPEIESVVRYSPTNLIQLRFQPSDRTSQEKNLKFEDFIFADSTFLTLFSFPLIDGNLSTCLNAPFSIVLSESTAQLLFSDDDPMGKSVRVNNEYYCTVTGILKDVPGNSSIDFNGIISMVTINKLRGPAYLKDMSNWFYATYILLGENADSEHLEQKIRDYTSRTFANNRPSPFLLRPLNSIYFNRNNYPTDYSKHGNMQYIYIFLAVAFTIILIAIINFINISTATASSRAKEVGVRKVVGSQKSNLIGQFLGETIILSLIAILLGIMITELVKPEFNQIIGKPLNIGYLENPVTLLYLAGVGITIGILSGIYPAFYLTSFKPVQVLKNNLVKGSGGKFIRGFLLVVQFVITIVLITATLAIKKQLNYIKNKDLGLDSEQVVLLQLNRDLRGKRELLKERLKQNPNIINTTFSSLNPGGMDGDNYIRTVNGERRTFYYLMTDPEFVDVLNLKVILGRNFHKDSKSEIGRSILLNETAVKEFELEEPIGTTFALFDTIGTVVGVVKDFHFRSLHNGIEPMSILCIPDWAGFAQIKVAGDNIPQTLEYIEQTWNEISPEFSFEYEFLDERFEAQYKAEEKFGKIADYFSIFAIFIACLGLFGLVSFTVTQRTKEISIRKVNGASVLQIVIMLTRELSVWILVSFLIACPIAYIAMEKWLQNFAYQTKVSWWLFIIAGTISFVIASLTMSYHAIKAALGDPSEGLRYE